MGAVDDLERSRESLEALRDWTFDSLAGALDA